ncbi:MAG TPA: thioredoxin family protein [Pseudogracilibacillus sp.]|nr:thioredoxin family protein [Pseudogracilibacillus sp.]
MRNKMIIIIGVIVVLFVGLIVINNVKNDKKVATDDNPYGDMKLHQETIDQLDDPLYQNIILPDQLDRKLAKKEDLTVYYFSPTCIHCINATPVVVPLVDELDIDMKKMNLLEFDKMEDYEIRGTPTIIHYEKGVEVARFEGAAEEEKYRKFFEENVK